MHVPYTLMHGAGNAFVVIDTIACPVDLTPAQISAIVAAEADACDQLLIVGAGDAGCDFAYTIYNADGTRAAQCGNGARCLARFAADRGYAGREQTAASPAGQVTMTIESETCVRVAMGPPRFAPEAIPFNTPAQREQYTLDVDGQQVTFAALSMGNPHAVLTVDAVDTAPVASIGPALANHAQFPERANVGFMQIVDRTQIRLRVWECGAGETAACGSGACAAVVAGHTAGRLDDTVAVAVPGGRLGVDYAGGDAVVYLSGPTAYTGSGTIDL